MTLFNKKEILLIVLFLVFNLILFIYLSNNSFTGFSFLSSKEKLSAPYGFINEKDIIVEPGKVTINLSDYVISKYDSSGSMIPVLDKGANGIGIKPKSPDDIHIGDIISFFQEEDLIVHRVIEKGVDEEGVFFVTKGDNNDFDDGKIRFSQIDSVLVILIY